MTEEASSVIARYVTKMRHMAQITKDINVADCLWSGAALLELMERQHRHLFSLLSAPPRVINFEGAVPPDWKAGRL